jgi:hypothetical protein
MTTTPHHITPDHRGAARAGSGSLLRTTSTYCAVVLSGLFAGFLVTVAVLEGSMRDEDAAVYTQVRLIELKHLDDLATALLIPALVVITALAVISFRRGATHRWTALIALALLLVTLIISVSISVPINTMQQAWSVASPPADWANIRDRWQLAHLARTATAVVAFVVLTTVPLPSRTS